MSVKREYMFKVVVLGYRLFFIELLFIVTATIGDDAYEHFFTSVCRKLVPYGTRGMEVRFHMPLFVFYGEKDGKD